MSVNTASTRLFWGDGAPFCLGWTASAEEPSLIISYCYCLLKCSRNGLCLAAPTPRPPSALARAWRRSLKALYRPPPLTMKHGDAPQGWGPLGLGWITGTTYIPGQQVEVILIQVTSCLGGSTAVRNRRRTPAPRQGLPIRGKAAVLDDTPNDPSVFSRFINRTSNELSYQQISTSIRPINTS